MHDPTPEVRTKRRATLTGALGFALLEPRTVELYLLHGWLDTWRGIGDIVIGMARQVMIFDSRDTMVEAGAPRSTRAGLLTP